THINGDGGRDHRRRRMVGLVLDKVCICLHLWPGIVPTKHPNKDGKPEAEDGEGRPLTKENAEQTNPGRTQSRERGTNGLEEPEGRARGTCQPFGSRSVTNPTPGRRADLVQLYFEADALCE